jgi:hypothetical protein
MAAKVVIFRDRKQGKVSAAVLIRPAAAHMGGNGPARNRPISAVLKHQIAGNHGRKTSDDKFHPPIITLFFDLGA